MTGEGGFIMRDTRGMRFVIAAACGLGLLGAWTTSGRAAGKVDEKLAAVLGKEVELAAHPTAKDPALLDYKESTPKDGRLQLTVKMKYFGKITSAKYTATVTITVDTTKEPPRVIDIDYKDDNKIPASGKKLKALENTLGKKLPNKL